MKQAINLSQFRDAFHNMGRGEQFSYPALGALFEYLEQMESDTGAETELDGIALCCDFVEFDNLADFQTQYNADEYPDMASIYDATQVIEFGSESFLIQQF